MRKPLDDFKVVHEGWFGSDPATYKQFSLKGHHGVDGIASIGAPVYAPEDGLVFMSANGVKDQYTGNNVAGNTIVIKGLKYEHWLLHLDRRLVFAGNQVEEGQLIGYSGNTSTESPYHLSRSLIRSLRAWLLFTNRITSSAGFPIHSALLG